MRRAVVQVLHGAAFLFLVPLIAWSRLPLGETGRFTAPSQLLALVPGATGVLLRRVWYAHTLRRCGSHFTVDWLAVVRISQSTFGDHCTLGVGSWVGWVDVGDNVLTGDHVTLLSGAGQHAFNDLSRPIRLQGGEKRCLRIGDDVWIGSQAIVLADVSPGTVIGAGSVVIKTHAPRSVIAGNPARVLRGRGGGAASAMYSFVL